MYRTACLLTVALLVGSLKAGDKPSKKNPVPPGIAALLKMEPAAFIRRFDRNGDGFLTKEELPPRLARLFERADTNGDGKLDQKEVGQMLERLREHFQAALPSASSKSARPAVGDGGDKAQINQLIDRILGRLDTNHDGKISREEAKGPLAENFDRLDRNGDGFLDREELQPVAQRLLRARKATASGGDNVPQGPDFDTLDANADGRLTPEELKGSDLANHFDEIDQNKDGKIDPKEFESYLKRRASSEKKK